MIHESLSVFQTLMSDRRMTPLRYKRDRLMAILNEIDNVLEAAGVTGASDEREDDYPELSRLYDFLFGKVGSIDAELKRQEQRLER